MALFISVSALAHDGPAEEHGAVLAFDPYANRMLIFKGTDHFNLDQYVVEFNATLKITKITKNGKVVGKEESGIFVAIDKKYGRILVYGDHGEFIQFDPYK